MTHHPIIEEDLQQIAARLHPVASRLAGKTLLLTGGAGFLGRYIVGMIQHLNDKHLERPCRLIVLDNFVTGLRDQIRTTAHVTVTQHDVILPYATAENVHFIIHAAGIASPVFYQAHRLETLDVGTLGTRNMLELAREKKVESFLLLSSSEVYGDPESGFVPTSETYPGNVPCLGPRACYDESKRVAETYALTYHEAHGVPTKIVRPFNVYGPGMRLDDRRVVPNFVIAALRGDRIPVYGDGSHTRSLCYVTDAIVGFFLVLFSRYNAEAFNIGNDGNEITMETLATAIGDLMANNARIGRVLAPSSAYGKADPKRRCPDLRKAQTLVDYRPDVDLVTGLKRFIDWAKEQEAPAR